MMPPVDIVIQSPDLPTDAVDAFRVACVARRVQRRRNSGRVTGPGGGEIVDAEGKAQAVRDACARIGCATDRSIVIGDGANDLKMLELAGLSVAYRAKPVLAQQASQALNYSTLDGVLAWFD